MNTSVIVVLSVLLWLGTISAEQQARFDNYQVYSLQVENENQLKILRELGSNPNGFEFWRSASHIGRSADIMVAPHQIATFDELVKTINIKSNLMVENVQS